MSDERVDPNVYLVGRGLSATPERVAALQETAARNYRDAENRKFRNPHAFSKLVKSEGKKRSFEEPSEEPEARRPPLVRQSPSQSIQELTGKRSAPTFLKG